MKISQRTIRLLYYLSTHGLLTPQIVNQRFISNSTTSAAVTWLRRLRESLLVESTPLFGQRCCSVLTPKAARVLRKRGYQVSRKATEPLSVEKKRELYAINLFCNEEHLSTKHLYRPFVDAEAYPRIAQLGADPFQGKRFIRDGKTLWLFIVDRGTPRFLNESVVPKVYSLIGEKKYPEFGELMKAGCFRLAIATGSNARADELLLGLEGNPPPMAAEVIVYPDLVHFLPQIVEPIA